METLLIVEDDEDVRTCMRIILEKSGYRVITAGDGVEAMEAFERHNDIALILTDVIMPRMNGMEMLKAIRETNPGIRAIFISGYTADCIRERGDLEDGAAYITKPFKKEELLQTIRGILNGP